jgi:ADP-ribose pyrophosphatase YjhB (NUDIX family)
MGGVSEHPPGWLPEEEYWSIFRRVTRACVEIVVRDPGRGVLLALRTHPPFAGRWHLPGGTILWGERVVEAAHRIAARELGTAIETGATLGYVEYPSHSRAGIDSPVGIALACTLADPAAALVPECRWFTEAPAELYEEQRRFLAEIGYL